MQARGALMREHRLIERMLSAIEAALAEIASTRHVDPEFVDVAVDSHPDVRPTGLTTARRKKTPSFQNGRLAKWQGPVAATAWTISKEGNNSPITPAYLVAGRKLRETSREEVI